MGDITRIVGDVSASSRQPAAELLALVYDELRRLAASKLARESPGQTLQPTALVHEVWLKLSAAGGGRAFNDRNHFFAAAAEAMRCILVDNARRKKAVRHGGDYERATFDDEVMAIPVLDRETDEILAVHDALDRLSAHDARKAELVKLRYFVGLTIEEAATVLDISAPTAKRDWTYSRAWLLREISTDRQGGAGTAV
jgi:RNA polymerase sigma factor (TIGR02999 family)